MNGNSTITYSTGVTAASSAWLSMDQISLASDAAEISEVADLLDSLYEIDPCTETDVIPTTTKPPEATFDAIVVQQLEFEACKVDYDGSYEAQIKVFRSDLDEPYKIIATNGEYLYSTTHREAISISTLVDNAEYVDLRMPVISDFSYRWEGRVVDENGPCISPEVTQSADRLSFGKKTTGKLYADFLTEWDEVTVKIHGVNNEIVIGNVVAFYKLNAYGLEVEHPLVDTFSRIQCPGRPCPDGLLGEDVECFENRTYYSLCQCSGDRDSSSERETGPDTATCPDHVQDEYGFTQYLCAHQYGPFYFDVDILEGYTACEAEDTDANDPEWYEGECGEAPPEDAELPQCLTVYDLHKGEDEQGEPLEITGGEEAWKAKYGEDTEFRRLMPKDGVCGTWTKEYILRDCDELAWYGDKFGSFDHFYPPFPPLFFNVPVTDFSAVLTYTIDGAYVYADAGFTTKTGTSILSKTADWQDAHIISLHWDSIGDILDGLSGWTKLPDYSSPDWYERTIGVTITDECGSEITIEFANRFPVY